MIKQKLLPIVLTICIFLTACSQKSLNQSDNNSESDNNELVVYTSFYTMYDFANKIGGDKIKVENLVPTGVEAHDWEQSTGDTVKLNNADILIYNGLGMEPWIDSVKTSLSSSELKYVEVSENINFIESTHTHSHEDEEEEHTEEHENELDHIHYDPHVWLDPQNAIIEMENIYKAFSEIDPDNKDYYKSNLDKYTKQLQELDNTFRETVAEFSSNKIIVSHEAFDYMCKAYGLTQIGVEGISSESEPSPTRMAEIIEIAKKNNIEYIFFEELSSEKVANAIANEAGLKVSVLDPIEGITDENKNNGEDYISLMYKNLEALKEALA